MYQVVTYASVESLQLEHVCVGRAGGGSAARLNMEFGHSSEGGSPPWPFYVAYLWQRTVCNL